MTHTKTSHLKYILVHYSIRSGAIRPRVSDQNVLNKIVFKKT